MRRGVVVADGWSYRALVPDDAVAAAIAVPLSLTELQRARDPAEDWMDDAAELLPSCLVAVIAAGPRRAFEFEQVVPGDEDPAGDGPILAAIERVHGGDRAGARRVLAELVAADVRCLDAYAHLGWLDFERSARRALAHFRTGVAVAERSLPAGFDGLLPWSLIDNRPFLRCLHGLALCSWRVGARDDAVAATQALLWLNPADNQGACEIFAGLCAGGRWRRGR